MKTKLKDIKNAMEYKEWDNGKKGYIVKETLKAENEELHNLLLKMVYNDNYGGTTDLSYEIVARATELFEDIETIEELENENEEYPETELSSIYTAERLEYLNLHNQEEITETMKEYEVDIQTACAIWYDNQVRNAYQVLRDYIIL